MILARPRARSMTKIDSKNSLYAHRYFTEQLVDVFKKLPWESDLNHEFSSLLIRRLKNKSGFLTQSTTSWDLLQNENHEVTTMSRPSCRRASAGNKPNAQAEQRKPETERWPQDPLERHEAGLSGNQIRASCTELASRKIKALSRARPDELGCLGEASTDSERKTDLGAPAHVKGECGL
jgi:hypothetical protein